MTDPDDLDDVRAAADAARGCLVEHFDAWSARVGYEPPPGAAFTTGLCRGAAWGLRDILRELEPDWEWSLDGGWGIEVGTTPDGTLHPQDAAQLLPDSWPGGMSDAGDGAFRGHFWVRGRRDGVEVVVDVTADQFGHEDVVVTDGDDLRYRSTIAADRIEDHFYTPERSWGGGMAWRLPPSRAPGM